MATMEPEPILDYAAKAGRSLPVGEAPVLTARQLAALACRVIALWLLAWTLEDVIAVFYMAVTSITSINARNAAYFVGPFLGLLALSLPVAAAAYLWVRSDRMAARMVADDAAAVPAGGPGYPGLLSVALTVAGAAVAVPAIRSLVSAIAYMAQKHSDFAVWWHDPYWLSEFFSAAVGIALGAWLLFGGRGIANLIVWARTAGHPVPDQSAG